MRNLRIEMDLVVGVDKKHPVLCPATGMGPCNVHCAWFSQLNNIAYCKDQQIGILEEDVAKPAP